MSYSEDDKLLDQIQVTAKSKGIEGVKTDFNLPQLYRDGKLHGDDMDYFLLTLFNECDETDKPRSVPQYMKLRGKDGKLTNINAFAKKILRKRIKEQVKQRVPLCMCISSCGGHIAQKTKIVGALSDPVDALQDLVNTFRSAIGHREVLEADGSQMKFIKNEFENWGRNIETNSILTFIPKTKGGLCNIVKWSKSKGLKVRASGFRHSWSNITVNDDQVLVSLLPIKQVEAIPTFQLAIDHENEFQFIELLDKTIEEDGVVKRLCKIGAGTTNEQFRSWIVDESRENGTWNDWWTLPFNVIMVEITFGGSNGPICHGAGIKSTTLSDLVASIEFVNANGELQIIDDPFQLKSVSGCFGMLGIVTSITMKLDPQTYARMIPEKPRLALAVPPPQGFDIPDKNINILLLSCYSAFFDLHKAFLSF
jgi:hypothetical protein